MTSKTSQEFVLNVKALIGMFQERIIKRKNRMKNQIPTFVKWAGGKKQLLEQFPQAGIEKSWL